MTQNVLSQSYFRIVKSVISPEKIDDSTRSWHADIDLRNKKWFVNF